MPHLFVIVRDYYVLTEPRYIKSSRQAPIGSTTRTRTGLHSARWFFRRDCFCCKVSFVLGRARADDAPSPTKRPDRPSTAPMAVLIALATRTTWVTRESLFPRPRRSSFSSTTTATGTPPRHRSPPRPSPQPRDALPAGRGRRRRRSAGRGGRRRRRTEAGHGRFPRHVLRKAQDHQRQTQSSRIKFLSSSRRFPFCSAS